VTGTIAKRAIEEFDWEEANGESMSEDKPKS
jgi:hypothetical protein